MQLLRRSTQVLQAIAENPGGLTLQELVNRLGIPLASMHRLLTAMSEDNLVVRSSATRRYVIGPMIHRLATGWNAPANLAEVTRPHLERLRREVSETAFVSQLLGDKVVCVALAESTQQLRLFVASARRCRCHAAAAARAILAYRPSGVRPRGALAAAGLQAFTNETKTDVDAIMRDDAADQAPGLRRLRERDRPRRLGGRRPHPGRHRPRRGQRRRSPRRSIASRDPRSERDDRCVQSAARAISSDLGTASADVPEVAHHMTLASPDPRTWHPVSDADGGQPGVGDRPTPAQPHLGRAAERARPRHRGRRLPARRLRAELGRAQLVLLRQVPVRDAPDHPAPPGDVPGRARPRQHRATRRPRARRRGPHHRAVARDRAAVRDRPQGLQGLRHVAAHRGRAPRRRAGADRRGRHQHGRRGHEGVRQGGADRRGRRRRPGRPRPRAGRRATTSPPPATRSRPCSSSATSTCDRADTLRGGDHDGPPTYSPAWWPPADSTPAS